MIGDPELNRVRLDLQLEGERLAAAGAAPTDDFGLVDGVEITRRGLQPISYDVDPIIERDDGPGLLTGAPSTFKSFAAMCTAYSMVTGKSLFGTLRPTRIRPSAVFLNLDAGATATENRFNRIAETLPANLHVATWREFSIERFERLCAAHAGGWVTIDCLGAVYLQRETRVDANEAIRTFLADLRTVYARHGCNGQVLDHTARIERDDHDAFAGPQQKRATIRQGIALSRDRNQAEGPVRIRFGCLKMSEAEEFKPFEVTFEFVDGRLVTHYCGAVAKTQAEAHKQADLDAICALLARGAEMSGPTLKIATGLPKDRVYNAIAFGVRENRLEDNGKGGRSMRYRLAPRP